jgi:hypothetical protein
MPPPSRLQLAKARIIDHFDGLDDKIFKPSQIVGIFIEMHAEWNLAKATHSGDFIAFLTEQGHLQSLEFPFPYRSEHRYTWRTVPFLEVLMTLKAGAYFSHLTAAQMHHLADQAPKTIYINHEQRPHVAKRDLAQGRIDAAFQRAPRVSNNYVDHGSVQICLVNGMHTGQLAVIEHTVDLPPYGAGRVRLTSLERTLIDLAVRPAYAGGASAVLEAFRLARDRLSVERLLAVLQKMNFVYPYHQAIGFYLESAGYEAQAVAPLRELPIDYDFYLMHEMQDPEYNTRWRLHVPKAMFSP